MILHTTIQVVLKVEAIGYLQTQRHSYFSLAGKAARERAKHETVLKEATEKHDAAVAKERKYDRVINRLAATAESKPSTTGDVQKISLRYASLRKSGGNAWWKPMLSRKIRRAEGDQQHTCCSGCTRQGME